MKFNISKDWSMQKLEEGCESVEAGAPALNKPHWCDTCKGWFMLAHSIHEHPLNTAPNEAEKEPTWERVRHAYVIRDPVLLKEIFDSLTSKLAEMEKELKIARAYIKDLREDWQVKKDQRDTLRQELEKMRGEG